MLCFLYGMIKYFGKEVVNYLLMGYMGFGIGTLVKDILLGLGLLESLDKKKLFSLKIK